MKIITKCIINMNSLETIYEDSYEYIGEIVECKGGSGGGGGSSGKIGYPDYVETVHGSWINDSEADTISTSMTAVMNAALNNSPFIGESSYNPDGEITAWENAIASYVAILGGIDEVTDWENFYSHATAADSDVINADVDAFADQLDDQIDTKILPKFRRGMQTINAVVSSAFPIGEAVIMGFRNRDVAKYASGLRIELGARSTEQMVQMMGKRIGWEESYAKLVADTNRIKIVAKKEEWDQELDIEEKDSLWDLKIFQYGGNLLGAPGGSAVLPDATGPSKTQSAIGGVMTGAAAGGMVGGPWGAAIGGVLGGASAFL